MTRKDLFKIFLVVLATEAVCRWPVKVIADKKPIKFYANKDAAFQDNKRKYHAKFAGSN